MPRAAFVPSMSAKSAPSTMSLFALAASADLASSAMACGAVERMVTCGTPIASAASAATSVRLSLSYLFMSVLLFFGELSRSSVQ